MLYIPLINPTVFTKFAFLNENSRQLLRPGSVSQYQHLGLPAIAPPSRQNFGPAPGSGGFLDGHHCRVYLVANYPRIVSGATTLVISMGSVGAIRPLK